MKRITLAALAIVVLGAVGVAAYRGLPQDEPPELRLRAVLVEGNHDVTDKVEWFVERDNAWLGPNIEIASPAVPGTYTAEFQVLGGAPFKAETTLGEEEGGEVLARLDASLVEIKLDEASLQAPVAIGFESNAAAGSEGLRVFEDGFVRALVSRDLRKLELVLPDQSLPITADFASGTILTFELTNGKISPLN